MGIRIMHQLAMQKFVIVDHGAYGRTLPHRMRHLDIQKNSVPISPKRIGNLQQSLLLMIESFLTLRRSVREIQEVGALLLEVS